MTRPGDRLRAMAARVCGDETMERLIDPLVADMQIEDAEAVRLGRVWRSRWVRMSRYVAFLKVIAFCALEGSIRTLHDGTADDRQALRRTIGLSIYGMIAAMFLVLLPRFLGESEWTPAGPGNRVRLLVYLAPQALPLSIPVGLLLGILRGFGGRAVSRRSQGAIMVVALVCSATSLATLAWIMPAGNQAFREWAIGRDAVTVPNELTFSELGRQIDSYAGTPMAGSRLVRNLKFAYHQRWALSCGTLVFAVFALSAVPRRRVGWMIPGVVGLAVCFGYYTLLWKARSLEMSGAVSPFIAAWLPNVVVVLGATAFSRWPHGDPRRLSDA